MAAIFVGRYVPGTPAWIEHRQGRVGGSDVAALFGLSPWQSPLSLWNERKGLVAPDEQRPQMGWGNRLEPVIVDAFRDEHPELNVHYAPGAVYAHEDRPWQVCSPDALVLTKGGVVIGGVEAKSSRYDDEFGKDGTAEVPPYYACQVQWSMDCFGVDEWFLAALFAGSDFRTYRIPAQPAFQKMLREDAKAFLDSIENDTRPPIDAHEQTYRSIRRLHPDIDKESDDVELGELGADFVAAVQAHEDAKGQLSLVRSRIVDTLGRAKYATYNGERIAYRKNGSGPPSLTAVTGLLKREFPAAS